MFAHFTSVKPQDARLRVPTLSTVQFQFQVDTIQAIYVKNFSLNLKKAMPLFFGVLDGRVTT
jgi:hypothetical protein